MQKVQPFCSTCKCQSLTFFYHKKKSFDNIVWPVISLCVSSGGLSHDFQKYNCQIPESFVSAYYIFTLYMYLLKTDAGY